MLPKLLIFLTLYFLIFYVLRLWVRKYRSDAAIVAIRTSQIPVTIISIAVFIKLSLVNLAANPSIKFLDRGLSAIVVLTATILSVRLIKEVLIYLLKDLAQKSEAQWDDVLIPFVETTLPIISYSVGIVLFLETIGINLSGLLVALGGIGLVIGFALEKVLADFFAGLFLLVDSPFKFGDVIALSNGTQAVIKKIGLRLTTLYVINQDCDLYVPNAKIQGKSLINIDRPTRDYYYTLKVPVTTSSDPALVVKLIESVILAHPDTLGNVSEKLTKLESFYGISAAIPLAAEKRDNAKLRLSYEQKVNEKLSGIQQSILDLSTKISLMEDKGLSSAEINQIKGGFLDISRCMGFDVSSEYNINNRRAELIELEESKLANTLIISIRDWYNSWIKDPNLFYSDQIDLPKQWEQKINLLKRRMNKTFKKVNSINLDDTRLDNLLSEISVWIQERFKPSHNEWQNPKIRTSEFNNSEYIYDVSFYVDDVRLEHYQRGERVKSEVNQELTWQLRKAYLGL